MREVGDGQGEPAAWDAARYAATGRFVADLGLPVVDLLDPRAGERVLDLGCGDGALTLRILDAGASVVGVDASPSMVAAATRLGIDARLHDARELPFDDEFDAVFSNAALHWVPDPAAVLDGVARALRPDGRFVAELGGQGNIAAIHVALICALDRRGVHWRAVDPWYFPSPGEYGRLLAAHGFDVRSLELIPRPTRLPGSMATWLATFARPWLDAVEESERPLAVQEVERLLAPVLQGDDGTWTADYVRLRVAAVKV